MPVAAPPSLATVRSEQAEPEGAIASRAAALGKLQITRASHVEPDSDGNWWADMGPVGGPVLGPFGTRGEALQAERGWLLGHTRYAWSNPSPDQRRELVHDGSVQIL